MDNYSSDNAGNRVSPTPENSHPAASQTALQLTNATPNADTSATVTTGKTYRFTALNTGGFYFGWADVTTAGNVRWACPVGKSIIIKVDPPSTMAATRTLHYACDTANSIGYLIELDE